MFNNVNDFPTWSTARASQDAVYIEIWPPHDRLDHLGSVAAKARALTPEKPVSLAAYLSSYARDDATSLEAMRLLLATVFSHGATCLLHGEADAILVDPYYVRHERMDEAGVRAARDLYDFVVRYGELLFGAVDVTRTHLGGINTEVSIAGPAPVASDCVPGAVWARVLDVGQRPVLSLIDLTRQADTQWDAAKVPAAPVEGMTVSLTRVTLERPRFFAASPEAPSARALESRLVDGYDVVEVPEWSTWSLVWASR